MATITGTSIVPATSHGPGITLVQSDVATLTDTAQIGVPMCNGHVYIGVYFVDSSGDQVDACDTGSFTISVKLWPTMRWEDPPVTTISATAAETISVYGPIAEVRAVPSSVTDESATGYHLRVSLQNA